MSERLHPIRTVLTAAFLFAWQPAEAANLSLTDHGIQADAGNLGQFTLSFPNLLSEGQDKTYQPIEKTLAGAQAVVKYPGGGTVTITQPSADTITLEGLGLPADARKLRVEMFIDFGLNEGGTWQTEGGQATPFPKQKPAKPFLYQGNNGRLKLANAQGKTRDVSADDAYYTGLRPPTTDAFGGLPGSGAKYHLKKTGFFHTEPAAQKQVLVNPDGNVTFHLGICGFQPSDDFTYIEGRESVYEWLPSYESEFRTAFAADPWWSHRAFSFYVANLIRKYGRPYNSEEWADRMVPRVRKWGFNASGAFSGVTEAQKHAHLPYVRSLPLAAWELGGHINGLNGLFDPFDAGAIAKMDKLFSDQVAGNAKDPLLVGYFLANEQPFEDIPRVIPSLKASQAAKRRLVEMLREKYQTIAAFNQAWGMQAANFDALKDPGLPTTSKAAAADLQAFTGLFITEYYQRVTETFHVYDTNHLLLGSRWQPGTANNEQLCRIAGRYLDVISVNYYTYGLDTAFLGHLHTWSGGKPMMLSEYYWSSYSDTGLLGGKELGSQRERGLAYRNYVEQTAALGYVVGIEWFTLIDQARTGRFFEKFSGEKANTGLLSVTDRPYEDYLDEMAKANYRIYDVLFSLQPPFSYADPRFSTGK